MDNAAINIDFKETIRISEKLSEKAGEMKIRGEEALAEIISDTRLIWQGQGAEKLIGKEARIAAQIVAEAENLQDIAQDLYGKAQRMYCAELTNNLLAGRRFYC